MNITKQSKVTLVELPPTQFGILNGNLSYDVYSLFRLPARAIHVLEGILKANGWTNVKSINPLYHGKKGKLTNENFKRIFNSDILGISSITRTSPQSIELARRYKSANPKGIVIAGGPDPTFRTEDWLKYVDVVVRGESEKTISELMERLAKDPTKLEDIKGIAFKKKNKVKITKPNGLLSPEELSQIPLPYYDKETRKKITVSIIETSRGCPNNCDFCSVTKFYGRKYRTKSINHVIRNIKHVTSFGRRLLFVDDNLAAIPTRTIELLNKIADNNLNKRLGSAQVTVRAAFNKELLKALKRAGIKILFVGVESINDETLKDLGKPYDADENMRAVNIFRENGFWVHGMMVVGGDGDTPETLKRMLEWTKRNLDSVQYMPLTPLPGTVFYERLEKEGRILTKDWSLYDAQHVVIKPKHFTPYELQSTIHKMYREFYSFNNFFSKIKNSPDKVYVLYFLIFLTILGGVKRVTDDPQSKAHLKFLKSIS